MELTRESLFDHVKTALKMGAYAGFSGTVVNGAAGILKGSPSPGMSATAGGFQWFALGSFYWANRTAILHAWDTGNLSRSDRTYASTIAGGFTGAAAGGVIRGPSNVLPGLIMFSAFGFLGQGLYNEMDKRQDPSVARERRGFWEVVANSRFSPMKVLSDEEYKSMLQERALRLDAEIAIIDENMKNLREQQGVEQTPGTEHE